MKIIERKLPQNINLPDKFYFNETENTKSLKKLIKKNFQIILESLKLFTHAQQEKM